MGGTNQWWGVPNMGMIYLCYNADKQPMSASLSCSAHKHNAERVNVQHKANASMSLAQMFIYYIIDLDVLHPVHPLVKGGHGRTRRYHCCPPFGGSDTWAPMGKLSIYSWGLRNQPGKTACKCIETCMNRKSSFHSHTGRVQEVASAAYVVTPIEM